jgi:3D-(3,5/4)-trihydroxycyclohexane-1,2-dione acylhydrolase (decyclizing)
MLGEWRAPETWHGRAQRLATAWHATVAEATAPGDGLPTDAQVLGAIHRASEPGDVLVCAAGGLPGELHKLWQVEQPGGYHIEYGYSCMGYEIAGGLGVKMARPAAQVWVLVGDGSYLMLNSEIVTAVCTGHKLNIVVLDNHGFGCIDRLQQSCGSKPFNNRLVGPDGDGPPAIDYAKHAAALGAEARRVRSIGELEGAAAQARAATSTQVLVIETDPDSATTAGGAWWEVAVPETSARREVRRARSDYEQSRARRRGG